MKLGRVTTALVAFIAPLFCCAQLNTTRVMEIGRNALYFEDYVLSIQYFNQVIDAKPFLHEPYFFRGLAKYYLDDYVGAVDDLTTAINKNPYVARSYQLRGLCYANMDSLQQAERDIRAGIEYSPQNTEMWQNLGAVAMQAGEWEKAAGVIDSLLLFAPRNSNAYMMRTQVALNIGDTILALSMVNKAVAHDKYSAAPYDTRAMVYYAMADYKSAEEDMNRSIDLFPTRCISYMNRGLVRYQQNNLRGAMSDFDMAIYVDSANLMARYNRGILRMELGENNKAIEDFNMVLGVDPDNSLARFNRGLLNSKVGNFAGAVGDYTAVIEAYPNFEEAYMRRAEARRECGDIAGAEADEKWVFDRRQEIYFNGIASVQQEYSADKDKTRKRSDENVRKYNKMIAPEGVNAKLYTTEARGKVQNNNVYIELEPLYVLTYYSGSDGVVSAFRYSKQVEELAGSVGGGELLLTNNERALAAAEVERHFRHIDELSKSVSDNLGDASVRLERAIDYYLVQDIEAAMVDANRAVAGDSLSWCPYFVRAFVRYKQLETNRLNDTAGAKVLSGKHRAMLPDIDYRLVKSDLDRVIELQPRFPEAYFNRANVSARLNDFKSAIVDYDAAVALDDRFAQAYFNRGLAKIYTGATEEGVADLSKAGELGLYQAYNVIKRFRR